MINKVQFKYSLFPFLNLTLIFWACNAQAQIEPGFEVLDWTDLIPPADLEALSNPPEYINDIVDGSPEDTISANSNYDDAPLEWESTEPGADASANSDSDWDQSSTWGTVQWRSPEEEAYQKALVSTDTVDDYNGKAITLPGFVVPLEFDDDMVITQFFLVPYFGACIHLPPPPPNQIILVDYPEGFTLEALHKPFWVSGELSIQLEQTDLGTSAYALDMKVFKPYEYEG